MKPALAAALAAIAGCAMAAAVLPVNQTRHVDTHPFDKVYLNGVAALNIQQGSATAVSLSGTKDAVAAVNVEIADGVLYLDVDDQTVNGIGDLIIDVTVIDLKELVSTGQVRVVGHNLTVTHLAIEDRGRGNYILTALKADGLIVDARGSSSFEMTGAVKRQVVDIAGAGHYAARDLRSQTSEINVAGAGTVDVWAEEMLDVRIAGAGLVRYAGSPYVQQQVFGAGSVTKVDR